MRSATSLQSYTLHVAARRAQFSAGFTALNDAAAIERARNWLADNDEYDTRTVRIVGSDGREVVEIFASSTSK